jgi:hypothetical protein
MSYAPLFNEFEGMMEALWDEPIDPSTERYKMLRKVFMSGAQSLAILAAEGKLAAAMDELEDFKTELDRGL